MKIKAFSVGPLATNCYVVSQDGAAVVIDPGFEHEKVLQYLTKENLKLHYIFLTHGHFDHIFDTAPLRAATHAAVVIGAEDADCLISPVRSLATQLRAPQPVCEADIEAYDGLMFSVEGMVFRFISTPGHTPGSYCILTNGAIFSGDTLFCGDCGRTDLPGGRYSQLLASLKRLYELDGDFDVYPGHDRPTTLGHEREFNLTMKAAASEDIERIAAEEDSELDEFDDSDALSDFTGYDDTP